MKTFKKFLEQAAIELVAVAFLIGVFLSPVALGACLHAPNKASVVHLSKAQMDQANSEVEQMKKRYAALKAHR